MRKRLLGAGVGTIVLGALLLTIAFPGLASAHTPSASGTASCAQPLDGTWIAHFTVNNDPSSSYGKATVSGTGTGLDGQDVPASGHLSLELTEPANVATVTLSGTLSWPKDGYQAPFSATVAKATGCTPEPKKVWVCKYVGTPGTDEILKDGKNPISVSVSSIPDYQGVGSYFADAQGRSFVLALDDGVTDHNASECPGGTQSSPPPTPTVTITAPPVTVTATVVQSSTVTETQTITPPASTVTIPGPTTTVVVPGPTVTLTETQTATATATETATATQTATATATQTATETATATVTAVQTVTATETVTESQAPVTVTQTVAGPASTVTVTAVGGKVTETKTATVTNDVTVTHTATVTKFQCPPNGTTHKGKTTYLSSTGPANAGLLSVVAGALLMLGTAMTFAGRQRRDRRAH